MDFIFSIPTPPAAIIFSPFQTPIGFVFAIPNITIGGGAVGGDIEFYVNGVLDQTITVADYSTAIINVD